MVLGMLPHPTPVYSDGLDVVINDVCNDDDKKNDDNDYE